jgi:hypothetical protein
VERRGYVNQTSLDAEYLVFVDETDISTKMVHRSEPATHEGAEMLACRVLWNGMHFPDPFPIRVSGVQIAGAIHPISPQRIPQEMAYLFDVA